MIKMDKNLSFKRAKHEYLGSALGGLSICIIAMQFITTAKLNHANVTLYRK